MTNNMKKVRPYASFLLIAIITVVGFNAFAAPKLGLNGLVVALVLTGLLGTIVLGVAIVGLAKRAFRP